MVAANNSDSGGQKGGSTFRLILGFAGLASLALAVLVVAGSIESDPALAGGGLAFVGLVVLALTTLSREDAERYLGRVKSLTLGGLGIELSDYAALATEGNQTSEDAESTSATEPELASTIVDLRNRLELKLTYLAKHVLAPNPDPAHLVPTFLTIGSLKYDGYLDEQQARIAADIVTMREYELRLLSESERRIFLEGASRFVDTVRISVFAAQVEKELEAVGFTVLPALRTSKRTRRDLAVQSSGIDDGIQHHVIPVFALTKDSELLTTPGKRLQTEAIAKGKGSRFLVVPPTSEAAPADRGGIKVVTLPGLLTGLAPSGGAGEADGHG